MAHSELLPFPHRAVTGEGTQWGYLELHRAKPASFWEWCLHPEGQEDRKTGSVLPSQGCLAELTENSDQPPNSAVTKPNTCSPIFPIEVFSGDTVQKSQVCVEPVSACHRSKQEGLENSPAQDSDLSQLLVSAKWGLTFPAPLVLSTIRSAGPTSPTCLLLCALTPQD